jgi:hypothetical protein
MRFKTERPADALAPDYAAQQAGAVSVRGGMTSNIREGFPVRRHGAQRVTAALLVQSGLPASTMSCPVLNTS